MIALQIDDLKYLFTCCLDWLKDIILLHWLYCRLAPRAFHELEDQAGRTNPKTKTQQGGQTLAEESVENDHQEAGQTTDGQEDSQADGQTDGQTEGQTLPAFYYDDEPETDFEDAAEE